ncbi:MAG TPA: helix-turn-helix domain-containing protein [Blastocatellia bacterium]
MFEKLQIPPDKSASEEDRLLDIYLSLSPALRAQRFADTSRAAQMAGVTPRAIQQWVAAGAVQACLVGKRYRVDLESLRKYLKRRDAAWADK